MLKVFSFIFMLALPCCGFAEADLYKLNADGARARRTGAGNAYTQLAYNECRVHVYRAIDLMSRRGHSYVHVPLRTCAGLEPEKLKKELEKKGFKVGIDSAGIEGVHYIEVMTVAW
jgi:hypothetical protein